MPSWQIMPSTCRRNDVGIRKTSFNKIIRDDLQLHCYVRHQSQKLLPQDFPQRLDFAHEYRALSARARNNFCWSDETYIDLNGTVNRQNARGRPDNMRHELSNCPGKVGVFLGVHCINV